MDSILSKIRLDIPSSTYAKDPQTSDLGKRILITSIEMISDIGFEDFTFKKLGEAIGSNESSIYRYFKNKHQLLVYLSCWYWSWLDYRLVFETNNLEDSLQKLEIAVDILICKNPISHDIINTTKLKRIMVQEKGKSFLTAEVDDENKKGYFKSYKNIILRIAGIITEAQDEYLYPKNLANLIVESSLDQCFLVEHFCSITDIQKEENIKNFLNQLIRKTLN